MKKQALKLSKMAAVIMTGCLLMLSTNGNVFAAEVLEEQGQDNAGISAEEQEYWENYQWEIYDIGTPEDWTAVTESDAANGVSAYSVIDKPGTWIQEADGRWWYKHTDGSYTANDWEKINGEWYYFDAQGYMFVGWLNNNGLWYYLGESGAMQTGWILVNGKYYFCDVVTGAMQTGWTLINGRWYYLDETNGDWIDNTGTQMIQEALKYVGNPYVYGGNSLTSGTDCSGYVKLISANFGITTPRTAAAQYTSAKKVSYSSLQPGDLVFYYSGGKVSHVAFYVGKINYNGRVYSRGIVHAANESQGICVGSLYGSPYGYGTYWR